MAVKIGKHSLWHLLDDPDEYGDDYLVYCEDGRYRVASYTRDYGWMCGTYYGGIKAWMQIPKPILIEDLYA